MVSYALPELCGKSADAEIHGGGHFSSAPGLYTCAQNLNRGYNQWLDLGWLGQFSHDAVQICA